MRRNKFTNQPKWLVISQKIKVQLWQEKSNCYSLQKERSKNPTLYTTLFSTIYQSLPDFNATTLTVYFTIWVLKKWFQSGSDVDGNQCQAAAGRRFKSTELCLDALHDSLARAPASSFPYLKPEQFFAFSSLHPNICVSNSDQDLYHDSIQGPPRPHQQGHPHIYCSNQGSYDHILLTNMKRQGDIKP